MTMRIVIVLSDVDQVKALQAIELQDKAINCNSQEELQQHISCRN